MSTGEALLRAVFADPDDAATALVYADWLEENGGKADQPLAAFIRVQRRLDNLRHGDPGLAQARAEEDALLTRHRASWLKGLPAELHGKVWFSGGFGRGVSLPAPKLVRHADALFARHPITEVKILGVLSAKAAGQLAAMRWWGRVRRLGLQWTIGQDEPLRRLLACPHLTALRALEADNCTVNTRLLAEWPGLPPVEEMRLVDCQLSAPALRLLLESQHLGRPRELTLSKNTLDTLAADYLARCERLSGLRSLWLYQNQIGPAGVQALASSPHLSGLLDLELSGNPIGDEGALALLGAFPHLRRLLVSGHRLLPATRERLRERFPFVLF